MRDAAHQMRLTVGEVCLDVDKSAYHGASARLAGWSLPGAPATRDLLLAKPSERAILVSNRRESEECPLSSSLSFWPGLSSQRARQRPTFRIRQRSVRGQPGSPRPLPEGSHPASAHSLPRSTTMFKTTVSAIALIAALGTASAAHAEWQCPYFNFAYYPTVTSCPNWQWDAKGPQAQAQAKAAAAVQAREQARAERAEQEKARAVQAAANQQAMAENSPNNLCRDPAVARQLITDFNRLTTWQQAVDIEHLTTNVGGTADRSCHGVFVLTNGQRLEGNVTYRKNVAGDPIVAWVDGGAASLPQVAPAPVPAHKSHKCRSLLRNERLSTQPA